jgi:hypothetical protein
VSAETIAAALVEWVPAPVDPVGLEESAEPVVLAVLARVDAGAVVDEVEAGAEVGSLR